MKKLILLFFITFEANAQFGNFLMPDSSDIYIIYNANKIDSLNTEIQKLDNQTFLADFEKNFGKYFDYPTQYKGLLEANVDEWEMQLFETRSEQIKFIKDCPSAKMKSVLEKEIQNNYWHLLFAYPIIRGNNDQKLRRVISLPNVMTSGFNASFLKNDEMLHSKAFRAMLLYWVTYKNSESKDFVKYSDQLQSVNDKVEFALKNLKGSILDYALAQILDKNKMYLTTNTSKKIISQISNEKIQETFFGKFLDFVAENEAKAAQMKKEKEEKEAKKGNSEFVDLAGKAFDFSKYKGKVIYVDFWASWCGPCRAEFPNSKKLHASLSEKEKEKIVFLYISIDDDAEKWKNGMKTNGLEEFENGFSEGGWGSKAVQKFMIKSIPRYMIVDKTGKIVDANAKRPSNPETFDDLLQLIK